jgi:hypothetical protein
MVAVTFCQRQHADTQSVPTRPHAVSQTAANRGRPLPGKPADQAGPNHPPTMIVVDRTHIARSINHDHVR